ncbi:hypothetical protein E4T49_00651 [Aureobasidium sp. EXF-10728]|nr:hypothetical protein E4T49_00651 [Aureobasidium sp. EXF-10728]
MAERKPKRQRFSLGGPAVDTSFEDYLTGATTHVSSDEEEKELDQENQDPEGDLDEDEEDYDEDEPEREPAPMRPAPAPTTTAPPITNPKDLVNQIHIHQGNTLRSSIAKNVFYLVHIRLLIPDLPVAVTRTLRVPAILLFEQFSDAIITAMDWTGNHLWKFTLEQRPKSPITAAKLLNPFPDERREICNVRDSGLTRDGPGLHNLGPMNPSKDLDSKKVRLMDVWNTTQVAEVRALRMFYTYDCYGDPWYTSVTFMGVVEQGLQAAELGVRVKSGQAVWCVGGSGASMPEDMPEEEMEEWEEQTNKHEWDIDHVNELLADVKFREVSSYQHVLQTIRRSP